MSLSTMLRRGTSALSFAHLAGVRGKVKAGAVARADDKDKKYDDPGEQDRSDGDSKKGKRARKAKAEDEDEEARAEDDDEGARAEDDDEGAEAEDDDEDGEADDEEDDEGEDKKGKRARRAKASDDDEEEMRGNSPIAKARRRERARCAAIFACKEAGANPVLAANLAFGSSMTRREAIRVLRDTPAAAAERPHPHSVGRRNPALGAGGQPSGPSSKQAAQSRMVNLMTKARDGSK